MSKVQSLNKNKLNQNLHICIAGKNSIAIYSLELVLSLFPEAIIHVLFNKNDKGTDSWQPSFRKYAESLNFKQATVEELYQVENLVFLSVEYDRIIKPQLFRSNELFNIHFSALPAYKGMYTSAWPILRNEKKSGVTLHKIDEGIDTGDIIDQQIFEIKKDWNSLSLYLKYLSTAEEVLSRNISKLIDRKYTATAQSSKGSSYYSSKSIDYSDISIDLNNTAFQISNQIRAFSFRHFQLPNVLGKTISNSEITSAKSKSKPGTLVSEDQNSITLSTIDYNIRLEIDPYTSLWEWAKGETSNINLESLLNLPNGLDLLNRNGWSALMIAAYNGHLQKVRQLVNAGSQVNATNYKGTTVLMYAFSNFERSGNKAIYEFLLSKGADPKIKDNSGRDVADYAKERKTTYLLEQIS